MSEFSRSLVSSFDFHFHWLPFWLVFNKGWSLSELLLACLRASRSLAPTQGNLEFVWELDSISATSKRRTRRGHPTISMTVSRTRSLGEYIFSDEKVTLLRWFSRCFSFLIYFPHSWWYALKKLKVEMIWFQRDLFIPSLGCSYQRIQKTKWTKINEQRSTNIFFKMCDF